MFYLGGKEVTKNGGRLVDDWREYTTIIAGAERFLRTEMCWHQGNSDFRAMELRFTMQSGGGEDGWSSRLLLGGWGLHLQANSLGT